MIPPSCDRTFDHPDVSEKRGSDAHSTGAPLGSPVADCPGAPRSLDEIELEAIAVVMKEVGGNISAAARRLGVSRNTLYRKLGRMN